MTGMEYTHVNGALMFPSVRLHAAKQQEKEHKVEVRSFFKNEVQLEMGPNKCRNQAGMKTQEDYPTTEKPW